MRSFVPRFLRMKMKSSSSTSSSFNGSNSSRATATLDRTSSSTRFCYVSSSSSSSESQALSSDVAWRKGVLQAQKVSSTDEVVGLDESTGTVESQIASTLSARNQSHELEEAFLRFDANRDGKISTFELGSVLRLLGDNPTDEELLLMVKEADRNGDGFIDLHEFVLLNSECSSSVNEDLHQAFLVFDANADGKISVEELYCVLDRLGESCTMEECGRMIQGVDIDGDGFVNFQEFCTMMTVH